MSSTRRSKDQTQFRQERYSSSAAYETALFGHLVAKRARMVEDSEDRAALYWLQQQSHKEGGLKRVVRKLRESFPDRIGTPKMFEIGKPDSDFYSASEIREIRKEFPAFTGDFPLNGESAAQRCEWLTPFDDEDSRPVELHTNYPDRYPVKDVREACNFYDEDLAEHLAKVCLDPEIPLKGKTIRKSPDVWYFYDLIGAVHLLMQQEAARAEKEIAETEVSLQICEDIEYALETKSLVIIEGLERMGKSVTAENFCRRHPGKAIYVRLESGTDEKTFFRSLARALGTSSSPKLKTIDIRIKIQDMLQQGDLLLVIDEAHFLWPQSNRSKTAPKRVDWVRTALVDFNVPVVLISTPQFDAQCKHHENSVGWNARQIKGRVALHRLLQPELSDEDLTAIARHKLPNADDKTLQLLKAAAAAKEDYVATIERIVKRATYFAAKAGNVTPGRAEIRTAFEEIIPPRPGKKPVQEPKEETPARGYHNRCKDISEPVKAGHTSRNRIRHSNVEEAVTT
ncbi:MAG: AAA family ATPase [Opitutales bacterium]